MGQIKLEHPELFALEFGKIAESDFVSSPEHEMLRVSYCNHSPSGIRPASGVRSHFLVYTSIYKY